MQTKLIQKKTINLDKARKPKENPQPVQTNKYDEFGADDYPENNAENDDDYEDDENGTRNKVSSLNKKKLEEQAKKELENAKNKK